MQKFLESTSLSDRLGRLVEAIEIEPDTGYAISCYGNVLIILIDSKHPHQVFSF